MPHERSVAVVETQQQEEIIMDLEVGRADEFRWITIAESTNHLSPRQKVDFIKQLLYFEDKSNIFQRNGFTTNQNYWNEKLEYWNSQSHSVSLRSKK